MARLAHRFLASATILALVFSAAGALAAPEDDLRRIEELKECIDRTDPTRGQNAEWRQTYCPDNIDQAKAQLARLLQEQQERVKKATAKAKKQAEEAVVAQEEEAASSGTSGKASGTSRSGTQSAGSTSLALPGLTLPPEDQALPIPQIVRDPCAAPSTLGLGTPATAPLAEFGVLPPVNTDLITWGVQQVEAMCRDLTGRLPQLPALPTVQAQLQVPTTLEVDKQVNDFDFNQLTQVGAGEVFFYDVFVTNNSGGEADGTLTDDLPNEFTLVDVVEGDFNDCNTTDPISCTITGLPDTETDFVSFVMQVPEDWCDDADPVTVVSNTANTFQDMTLTGTDTVLVDVICPELDVEKIVPGGGELESGETFQYQISLTNNSEDPVDATITDELPADFVPGTFLEFGGFDCTLTGQTLDCIVEGLEAGATAIVIINMTVPEDFCSGKEPVPNTVEASQVIEGVEFFADRDTYKVDVLCSDVAIEKSADDDDYFTGEIVTYTLVVINYGPGVAQNITLDDLLPEGLQFLSVSTTQGSCAHQGGGLVHCELGDLGTGRGDVIEITITARITNAAECSEEGTKLKNTAEVAADNEGESLICELDCEELILADSQSSFELSLIGGDKNNSSTAKIFIHCAPNIVITKTAELSGDGTQVTYIITAKNIGTAEATGVVVNDDLDDALTDPQASTTGDGPCVIGSGNTVSCNIGSIPIDGSETVTITAGVPVGVCPARNSAEGAAENEAEGARSDNTDSAGVGGDCVLGTELTRDGVLGLALTGFGMVPLAMMGGLLLLSGATLRRLGRDRRRPWS